MVKCAKVEKKIAESVLIEIKKCGLLESKYRIDRDESFVYIPLKNLSEEFIAEREMGGKIEIIEREMVRNVEKPRHYSELLSLPPDIMKQLPSGFDIVGDIAIIKLPAALLPYEKDVALALLQSNHSIKTVLADEGVEGDYRIRRVRWIGGIEKTKTLHREHGLRFEVDLAKVYFSPRLANERQLVVSAIVPPCVVIDMFAGIGPFSITIAKKHASTKVYAIDKNPDAYYLLLRNITLNRVNNVFPVCGDAVDEIQKFQDADYIIMNLPHNAERFLFNALGKIKKNGKIFLYTVSERNEIEKKVGEIKNKIEERGRKSEVKIREVHTYSPTSSVFCIIIWVYL